MRRETLLALLCGFCGLLSGAAHAAAREPIDWVDPRIGTAGVGSQYGGTAPVVGPPFGMTPWSPLTRQNRVSVATYNDADRRIQGFIGTHQAAIWMGRLRLRHADAGDRRRESTHPKRARCRSSVATSASRPMPTQ